MLFAIVICCKLGEWLNTFEETVLILLLLRFKDTKLPKYENMSLSINSILLYSNNKYFKLSNPLKLFSSIKTILFPSKVSSNKLFKPKKQYIPFSKVYEP